MGEKESKDPVLVVIISISYEGRVSSYGRAPGLPCQARRQSDSDSGQQGSSGCANKGESTRYVGESLAMGHCCSPSPWPHLISKIHIIPLRAVVVGHHRACADLALPQPQLCAPWDNLTGATGMYTSTNISRCCEMGRLNHVPCVMSIVVVHGIAAGWDCMSSNHHITQLGVFAAKPSTESSESQEPLQPPLS